MLSRQTFDSPLGRLALEAIDDRLTACRFIEAAEDFDDRASSFLKHVTACLKEYFQGKDCLAEIPLHHDGTDFQQDVWRELCRVPFGETATYGDVATRTGRPYAFRAVAQACGANRICLFIPCHRIVAANGLGGFSQGIGIKRQLLKLEGSSRCDR